MRIPAKPSQAGAALIGPVLITGGAGFIGSHLVDALVAAGRRVTVFDNLDPQVHGDLRAEGRWPAYANPAATYVLGDVRDREALAEATRAAGTIYHLAACTGVGQSMYEIARYVEVNVQGTANLLDVLARERGGLRKLVLASSRAVYGEGAYRCSTCGPVHPPVRSPEQLASGRWEPDCPSCCGAILPAPTPETLAPAPGSIYAITKLAQEQLCARAGEAYGFPVTVLRFFNVYGPRQALANPYTGIITTFLNRLRAGAPLELYEDGLMTRDFVHVSDAVQALVLASDPGRAAGQLLNIGSGVAVTMARLAELLIELSGAPARSRVTGAARVGDIRHCDADIGQAGRALGYAPRVALAAGLADAVAVAAGQPPADRSAQAYAELAAMGLVR